MWKSVLVVVCCTMSIPPALAGGTRLQTRISEDLNPIGEPDMQEPTRKTELDRLLDGKSRLDRISILQEERIRFACRLWLLQHYDEPWSKDKAVMTLELAKCETTAALEKKQLYDEVITAELSESAESDVARAGLIEYFLQAHDIKNAKAQVEYLNKHHRLKPEQAQKLLVLLRNAQRSK